MKIGIPKEIKIFENRVAITPAGVHTLVGNKHTVYIEKGAGVGSGFTDKDYEEVGAKILNTAKDVFDASEMIMKVKEPLPQEYSLIKEGQILFTYLHLAADKKLTEAMIASKAICIAYETVQPDTGGLPLLTPMSEVAGKMAAQQAAHYLEKPHQGKGLLMGGVPGVRAANVMVIGGGVVGTHAAQMCAGLGANVTILDKSLPRLRYLDEIMPKNVRTMYSDALTIKTLSKTADVVIGAVLNVGAKAPIIFPKELLKDMAPGSVLVDVAIDQGGCFETSKATSHQDPIYVVDGITHYCVANIPGAVPMTSTMALTNATLPYALKIANMGWKKACDANIDLKRGLNVVEGKITYKPVAETFNLPYTEI